MAQKKSVTVREIAKLADVSTATVSLVLNDKKGVSNETRERIWKLMRDNNYVSRRPAETPVQTQICYLRYIDSGLVVEVNQEGSSCLLDGVSAYCGEHNIALMMHSVNAQNLDGVLAAIRSGSVNGIILLGVEIDDQVVEKVRQTGLPFVVVDNSMLLQSVSAVTVCNKMATYDAVKHLYELGHRKIGYLKSNVPAANFAERSQGYSDALRLLHLEGRQPVMVSPTMTGSVFTLQLWMSQRGKDEDFPTAFVADNDCIAIAAVKVFQEFGLRVPEDVSVVGIGGIAFTSMMTPPLTTVHIPYTQIGRKAVVQLLSMMEHPEDATETLWVHGTLIVRGSTAKAPDGAGGSE